MSIADIKEYYIQCGIGKCKYVVNYCDGNKRHKDGSIQHDMKIYKSKTALNKFVNKLRSEGYVETL